MNDRIGAVIVAAGLSSRMNDFKPLLTISDITLIEMVVKNFQSIGVHEIVIVTGYRGYDIEQKLLNYGVTFVKNEQYETTHMFDSICIGLKKIAAKVDTVFLTPADSPYVQKYTLDKMIEEIKKDECSLIQPSYEGKSGHPLLLKKEAINEVLKHDGSDGLHGAISKMKINYKNVSFVDPGIVLDADTIYEYFKLVEFEINKHCPSLDLCTKIQDYFFMPIAVKKHSSKVASVALIISQSLYKKGIALDNRIILAASLLHDIAKIESNHAKVGAEWLECMGYNQISKIVSEHMELKIIPDKITEKEVVYIADKLVQCDYCVTIEEKFTMRKEFHKNDKAALLAIEKREKQAIEIYELINKIDK